MKQLLSLGLVFLAASATLKAQIACPNPPVVTVAVSNTTPCEGETITLTASGADNYMWTNNVQNGVGFVPTASDNYTVVGTDSVGCADTTSVFVDVLALPPVVANSSSLSICLGDSIQLTATGGQSYNWITPAINNGDFFVPVDTGANIYVVEATGANGCTNTSQVIVVVKPVPASPMLNTASIATCVEVDFEEQIVATSATGRPIWYRDQALSQEYQAEAELVVPNNPVDVRNFFATTFDGGCFSAPVSATVEVYARPVIDAGGDITLTAGDRAVLGGMADGNIAEVEWLPSTGLSDPFSLQPEFVGTNREIYTLRVVDDNNCVSTDEVRVNVRNELIISNIITPNGDGDNDVWKIYPGDAVETCDIIVYDGFGREVFTTNRYQNNWDGSFEGAPLPDGDYYYQISCDGVTEKGTLVIIK